MKNLATVLNIHNLKIDERQEILEKQLNFNTSTILANSADIGTLKSKYDEISKENKDKCESIAELEKRIKVLEEKSNMDFTENISDGAISELQNRLFKLNNIIVYGVKEDLTLNNNYSYIHKMLKKIVSGVKIDHYQRIGNQNENQNARPIRVEIRNRGVINNLIKNKEKLPDGVSLSLC